MNTTTPKIIVEVCQNHNGKRGILKDMIGRAADAGADIIKGQIIFSEDLVPRERFENGEELDNGVRKSIKRPYGPEFERLQKLDLTPDDYAFFVEEVRRAGSIPMLTVFTRNRIPLARSLPWAGHSLIKVASYDCASIPLLKELSSSFDELIVSTGATFDTEIKEASTILAAAGLPYAMLHCVTSYPNTRTMAHLARIEWLRQFAPRVGWSDHSLVSRDGIVLSKIALACGADYIERHFTILGKDETKDGPVSITPELLAELVVFAKLPIAERIAEIDTTIPNWRETFGHTEREMSHTEMLNRDYYRGRFASRVGDTWINNWDDTHVPNI